MLGYEKASYPVKVLSSKGDHLIINNPQTALGSYIQIPRGNKVTLSFFTKSSKGYSFESRILGVSEAAVGQVMQLLHSNKVSSLSKRKFRRRQLAIPAEFFLVNLEQSVGNKKTRLIVDKRGNAGTIMDISVGGCSIKTNSVVSSGSRLKIEAGLGGKKIAVLGQVLRTNRSGAKSIVHVSFLKIPGKSLNAINAAVYEYADDE